MIPPCPPEPSELGSADIGEMSGVQDRPLAWYLRPARRAFRMLRLLWAQLVLRKKLAVGRNVYIGAQALLQPPEFLRIGNNVAIGPHFFLQSNLEIGPETLLSAHVAIVGNDHSFSDPSTSVFFSPRLPSCTTVIEGDNLIGFGVTIVGNVRIGRGAIIGARSVVTRDVPPNMIYAGIPARLIRPRFPARTF